MLRDAREYGPQLPHPRFVSRDSGQAWIMPIWLVVIMFGIIVMAAVWSVIVCLIHHRGTTTGMMLKSKSKRKQEAKEHGAWRARLAARFRPFAKTMRYEVLRGGEELEERTSALAWVDDTLTSACSPPNPFLAPPDEPLKTGVKVRSSREWAEEHRAFFSTNSSVSPIGSTSRLRRSSSSLSLSSAGPEDVVFEAREAQERRSWHARNTDRSECKSWVDLGLAMVDDAVDRAAARIVRWADDNGGGEALVLPLTKGKED